MKNYSYRVCLHGRADGWRILYLFLWPECFFAYIFPRFYFLRKITYQLMIISLCTTHQLHRRKLSFIMNVSWDSLKLRFAQRYSFWRICIFSTCIEFTSCSFFGLFNFIYKIISIKHTCILVLVIVKFQFYYHVFLWLY